MVSSDVTEFQHDSVRSTVLAALAGLPDAERRVADIVLGEPEVVHRSSIGRVAELANTSAPTVVRFARRLGFGGFTDLKLALATDQGRADQFGRPSVGSDRQSPLDRAITDDIDSLRAMASSISNDALGRAAGALVAAPQVLLVGAGSSGALAELATYRFLALGIDARTHRDPLQFELGVEAAPTGSVLLAISHTGATRSTLHTVRTARASGLTTIGITSHAKSQLAELSDVVLNTGSGAPTHRLDMFTNRVEHLSLLSALHDACAARSPHPGGGAAAIAARHMD